MVNFSSVSALLLSFFMGAAPAPEAKIEIASETPLVLVNDVNNKSVLIDDFSTEIWSWWDSGNGKWKRSRDNGTLKVVATEVGKEYECFGKQFDAVDFTKTPVLKLKVKSDAEFRLRINLKDYDGNVNNDKPIIKKVEAGNEFKEYYFDFTNTWKQSYPDVQEVDPVEIVELLIFVNPGMKPFSGTIYIDDVEAVPVSAIPADKK